MEIYRLNRTIIKGAKVASHVVSSLTKKPFLFHFVDSIWCYIHYGCEPEQYASGDFYKMKSYDRKDTYTIGRSYEVRKLMNGSVEMHFLSNKRDFNTFFAPYIRRDWVSCENCDLETLDQFVRNHDRIIVKPMGGMKGKGIFEFDKSNLEPLKDLVGKKILLEECIASHPLLNFNNKSLNTIRIITLLGKDGNVHVLKAALRCGVGDALVDNMSAGGVAYPVNINYGRIDGPGLAGTYSLEDRNYIYVHPGTDTFMVGCEIPFWEEVLSVVRNAASKLSQVRLVGWDVAVTDHGAELIEGNSRPGPATLEYFGGQRGFYKVIMSQL